MLTTAAHRYSFSGCTLLRTFLGPATITLFTQRCRVGKKVRTEPDSRSLPRIRTSGRRARLTTYFLTVAIVVILAYGIISTLAEPEGCGWTFMLGRAVRQHDLGERGHARTEAVSMYFFLLEILNRSFGWGEGVRKLIRAGQTTEGGIGAQWATSTSAVPCFHSTAGMNKLFQKSPAPL